MERSSTNARLWFWIVVAAALLIATFVALRSFERGTDRSSGVAESSPAATGAIESSRTSMSDPAEAGERTRAATETQTQLSLAAPTRLEGRISGRVVDFADRPVPGATIAVFEDELRAGAAGEPRMRRGIASTTTDAEGRFELRALRGRAFELDARKPGLACARIDLCSAEQVLTIRLAQSPKLAVRVRRPDGVPAEGVQVRVMPVTESMPGSWTEHAAARTDALGRADFADLPVGPVMLAIEPATEVSPKPERLEIAPGATLERTFDLVTGETTRGRVVDSETKEPIAGARVSTSLRLEGRVVLTDAQGEYTYPGIPSQAGGSLHVDAPGYGRLSLKLREGSNGHVHARLDFELRRERVARGRVLAPDGVTPILGVRVEAQDARGEPLANWDRRAARTGDDGRFEITNLRRDVRHRLWVQAIGFARIELPFPSPAPDPGSIDFGDIVLQPSARASGRVLDAEGRPVTGQHLRANVYELQPEKTPTEREHRMRELDLRSDHLGRFELADLPAGRLEIEAVIGGMREVPKLAVAVEAGRERRELVLVVDLGVTISGRIVDPSGAPIPMVNLTLRKADGTRIGHSVLRTGSDGAFLCPALEPGRYQIVVWPENRSGDEAAGTLYAYRVLEDVEAGTHDMVVRLDSGRFTRGVVHARDGKAARGVYVCAKTARGTSVTAILSDEEGRFQLLLSPLEEYEIEARPAAPASSSRTTTGQDPATFARIPGIRGGAQGLELRLP